MKKALLLLIFFSFSAVSGFTQDIDFVITKYFQAIGGKNRIDTIQNYSVEYTGSIDDEEVHGTYLNVRPYLFRFEIIKAKTGGITCVAYDGKDGWMSDTRFGKDSFKPHERFLNARNRGLHSQNFMNYLIYAQENGYVMQLTGLRKIDSTMCYCIKLQNYERDMKVECFIDVLTFLLKKEVHSDLSVPDNDPKKVYEEINYLNYKPVNGILLPCKVKRISTILHTQMIVYHEFSNYQFNQKIEIDELRCELK